MPIRMNPIFTQAITSPLLHGQPCGCYPPQPAGGLTTSIHESPPWDEPDRAPKNVANRLDQLK